METDPKDTILFVGAGVSMGLGLPSWESLIDEVGRKLGYDHQVFRLFGTPLSLAEYYSLEEGGIDALGQWLDLEWHKPSIDISKSRVHELIVKRGFKKIYTTNFDRWIEKAFDHWGVSFHKIVTANDIPSNVSDKTEVIKFHGDFDLPKSLVLTESQYFDRLTFESSLDLTFRADVLRYPVTFVGYSLADVNLRYLFHKLLRIWLDAGDSTARPQSCIFMARPNPIDERIFQNWGIKPVVGNSDDPAENLALFLSSAGLESTT